VKLSRLLQAGILEHLRHPTVIRIEYAEVLRHRGGLSSGSAFPRRSRRILRRHDSGLPVSGACRWRPHRQVRRRGIAARIGDRSRARIRSR
jgi:hypothetical protein